MHEKSIENLKTAMLNADEEAEILSMIGIEYLYLEDFDNERFKFYQILDV